MEELMKLVPTVEAAAQGGEPTKPEIVRPTEIPADVWIDRAALATLLQQQDPNGCHEDEQRLEEWGEVATLRDLQECAVDIYED